MPHKYKQAVSNAGRRCAGLLLIAALVSVALSILVFSSPRQMRTVGSLSSVLRDTGRNAS